MEIIENEVGGETVVLSGGDSLDDVPASHRHLITPAIRSAFADPYAHFARIAQQSPFSEMKKWVETLITTSCWTLELNLAFGDRFATGFFWNSKVVRFARIDLPSAVDLTNYPVVLQSYYALVGAVDWMGFGCAGKLRSAGDHRLLADYGRHWSGDDVQLDEAYTFGDSPCGDILFFDLEGRGGWASHDSFQIHLLGSIAETMEWIFAKLNARECPEWDQSWY